MSKASATYEISCSALNDPPRSGVTALIRATLVRSLLLSTVFCGYTTVWLKPWLTRASAPSCLNLVSVGQVGRIEISLVGVEIFQIEKQALVMDEVRASVPRADVKLDQAIARNHSLPCIDPRHWLTCR